MSKYALTLFLPKRGKIMIPTALKTPVPFDRCPACLGERVDVTPSAYVYSCGMSLMLTDGDEFAVGSGCPYSMAVVYELRTKRLRRESMDGPPATLATFSTQEFKVGDKVRWTSRSAGSETLKKGKVVAVVPPEARPESYIPCGLRKNSSHGYGKARPHTTYLVRVMGKGSMTYWPRVHCLEPM